MHGNQQTLTTSIFEGDMLAKKCAKNESDQKTQCKKSTKPSVNVSKITNEKK